MYTISIMLYIYCIVGRFKKHFFSQMITSKRFFFCSCSQKVTTKNFKSKFIQITARTATPSFFGSLIQVKFRKMTFLARSFHFMFLESCSFNINGRKAFCLFWVSKLYDHAQQVFWQRPFFTGEIPKNGLLARSSHFMFLEPCSFNINGRKAFRLFWVSKQCGHAQSFF